MIEKGDVKDIVILGYLTDPMVEKLLPHLTLRRFDEREIIFRAGDAAETFFMLKRGKVLLEQRITDTMTFSVGAIKPGFSFGWSSMLGGGRYSLDTVSAEPSEAFGIPGKVLLRLLDEDHDMGFRMMQRLLRVVKRRLDNRTEKLINVIRSHPDIKDLVDGKDV